MTIRRVSLTIALIALTAGAALGNTYTVTSTADSGASAMNPFPKSA